MNLFNDFTLVTWIFAGVFLFAWLLQMIYYWSIFSRLAFYKSKPEVLDELPPVSIVLCARNEYYNLNDNLPVLLSQDYPDFEVVVVNHASDDDSGGYLKEMQRQHSNLKVVTIERDLNFFTGKKFPLSMGIKSAANDILVLTDADCRPAGKNWLSSMVKYYGKGTEIVLGYGPYERKSNLLNILVRYDTFMVAMQYLSYALSGMPYMGVGRNLSYRREMFFRNKGFTSHYKIQSGDDDLFINQVASKKNTRINIEPESFQFSRPKNTFSQWLSQKQRHLSTGKHYKSKFKFLLGMFNFTQLIYYAAFIGLLILWVYPYVVIAVFMVRLITVAVIHKYILEKLQEKHLYLFSLIAELFYILFITLISFTGLFRRQVKWK